MARRDSLLLRLHIEAVWNVRLPSILYDDVVLLQPRMLPAWKLLLADLASGERLHIWRPNIGERERHELLLRADMAFAHTVSAMQDISREIAFYLEGGTLSPRAEHVWQLARPLTLSDDVLVRTFLAGENFVMRDCQPLCGVVVDNTLCSLAHSSRRTKEACELGIDTLPGVRRKGYALAATALWAKMVMREGRVPLYSALAENVASQQLAIVTGYRMFAQIMTIA